VDKKCGKPWAVKVQTCRRKVGRNSQFSSGTNRDEGFIFGIIARLNPKGFGFITPGRDGNEIYFHSTSLELPHTFDFLTVGQEVRYKKGWDKKNDKEMAECVSVRDPPNGPQMTSRYSGISYPSMLDNPGRDRYYQPGPRRSPIGIERPMDWMRPKEIDIPRPRGDIIGRVGMKNEKGFGFIESLNGGERIYFHSSSMKAGAFDKLVEGDKVSFVMGWDSKHSKEMAEDVRILSRGQPDNLGQDWIGKLTGRISKINQKGFGFIETGEGDLYFHSTCLQQVAFDDLKVGDDIAFIRGWDKIRSKEMAKLVELRYNNRGLKREGGPLKVELRDGLGLSTDAQPPSKTGNIVQLNNKGFGFIMPEGGKDRIYFHSTGLVKRGTFDELKEGDAVVYEEGFDRKNMKAMAVGVELQ